MSLVNDMLEDLDRRAGQSDRLSRATRLRAPTGQGNTRRVAWVCFGLGSAAVCGIAAVSIVTLAALNRTPVDQAEAKHSLSPEGLQPAALLPSVGSAPPAPPAPERPAVRPLEIEPPAGVFDAWPLATETSPTTQDPPLRADPPVVAERSPAHRTPLELVGEAALSETALALQFVREGDQLLAAGRFEAGLDAWRRALELDSGQTSLIERGAEKLVAAGFPLRAQAWLEAAPAEGVADPTLRMLVARLALELEGPAAALASLEVPRPELHEETELYALRAALLQREERHEEALVAYRALVADAPGRGRLWFGLAVSAEALGRIAEANVALHHALDDPELPPVLAYHASIQVAENGRLLPVEHSP